MISCKALNMLSMVDLPEYQFNKIYLNVCGSIELILVIIIIFSLLLY